MEGWQERLVQEGIELSARLEKLCLFIGSKEWFNISDEEQKLLWAQHDAMQKYRTVLLARTRRLPNGRAHEAEAPGVRR